MSRLSDWVAEPLVTTHCLPHTCLSPDSAWESRRCRALTMNGLAPSGCFLSISALLATLHASLIQFATQKPFLWEASLIIPRTTRHAEVGCRFSYVHGANRPNLLICGPAFVPFPHEMASSLRTGSPFTEVPLVLSVIPGTQLVFNNCDYRQTSFYCVLNFNVICR